MSRILVYDLRVQVEVPDGSPDPAVDDLFVSVKTRRRGEVLSTEGVLLPTEEELEAAAEAAAALVSEGSTEMAQIEEELGRIRGRAPVKVRGFWVERLRGSTAEDEFAVYDGAFPGGARTREQAALEILKRLQRAKMTGGGA